MREIQSDEGDYRKYIVLAIIILIVLGLVAYFIFWNDSFGQVIDDAPNSENNPIDEGVSSPEAICGDGICSNSEIDDNSCAEDCGETDLSAMPEVEDYIEPPNVCGDGICSNSEIDDNSCAEDCGEQ